ncbi:MAG TPA: ATP-binding protein [Armatimonadota bacterium]|nr:ATP-binding protein [Armatimonadota bacterium]
MAAAPQGEVVRMRIPSDPKYVSGVRQAIHSIAYSLGFSADVAEDIELSVAEALTNALEYGSPEQKTNAIVVVCRIADDKLTIDVRDEGPGFDLPESECRQDLMDERGRGLRLIYHLMDNVRVCHTPRGARIRMVKKFSHEKGRPLKPSR